MKKKKKRYWDFSKVFHGEILFPLLLVPLPKVWGLLFLPVLSTCLVWLLIGLVSKLWNFMKPHKTTFKIQIFGQNSLENNYFWNASLFFRCVVYISSLVVCMLYGCYNNSLLIYLTNNELFIDIILAWMGGKQNRMRLPNIDIAIDSEAEFSALPRIDDVP